MPLGRFLVPFLLLVMGGLVACEESVCTQLPQNTLRLAFRRDTVINGRLTLQDTLVQVDTVYGLGRQDSLILVDTAFASRRNVIFLPLNSLADSATFVIQWRRSRTQRLSAQLTIGYRREPYLISEACGFGTRFRGLTVRSHTFGPAQDSLTRDNLDSNDPADAPQITLIF